MALASPQETRWWTAGPYLPTLASKAALIEEGCLHLPRTHYWGAMSSMVARWQMPVQSLQGPVDSVRPSTITLPFADTHHTPQDDQQEHDMFVLITWKSRKLAVPLSQLEGIGVDEETQQAIEDWRYWVERGYEF